MTEQAPRGTSAKQMIAAVLDPGSWRSWDEPIRPTVAEPYLSTLHSAAERSGYDEAVRTGEGLIRGRRVAVVAGEFEFLAGSIGRAAADRLVAAVQRATREGLPLLASPTSGGTRMQEGTAAFVQMLRIAEAISVHRAHGLAYLVYLRHPTTGGVLASWGSLGHVTVAEPGALIGFLGPRVYRALYGQEFPAGVQTAENLYHHGLVDAVLAPTSLADMADRALGILARETLLAAPMDQSIMATSIIDVPDIGAWDSVQISRRPDRPGVRRLLFHGATDVVRLHGTGEGESDPGLLLALARFGGYPCVVLGQDRRSQTPQTPLGPGALRAARRGMKLSAELRLPLVTVIDTPGAALSKEAEEGGLAGEIARSLHDLITLPSPSIAVILGQGTGGGALALLPADRVVCAQHGWLAPLPPEGASELLHRTTDLAGQVADEQGIRSRDLLALGIVDAVVLEPANDPELLVTRISQAISYQLSQLADLSDSERNTLRSNRLRAL